MYQESSRKVGVELGVISYGSAVLVVRGAGANMQRTRHTICKEGMEDRISLCTQLACGALIPKRVFLIFKVL